MNLQSKSVVDILSNNLGKYTIVKMFENFVNILVGDLALRNHRHNGDQYENDEAVGDDDHVFQLRLCLHTRITHGYRGIVEFFLII